MKLYSLAAAGLVIAIGLPAHAAPVACVGQPGSVSDPLGDAYRSDDPDIVCSSAQVANGQLILSQAYGAGFDVGTTVATFYLDIDRNAATGVTDSRTPGLGIDSVVQFGSTAFGPGLWLWTSASVWWSVVDIDLQVFDDGFAVSIPLSLLASDGALNFAAITTTRVGYNATTGVLDYTAVGSSVNLDVPEPASAALVLAALGALAAVRRGVR